MPLGVIQTNTEHDVQEKQNLANKENKHDVQEKQSLVQDMEKAVSGQKLDFEILCLPGPIRYAESENHHLHCEVNVFVNFQEDGAVRSLAKALLKRDFDLEVELPHGCLVLRVPQRLNYILFVEDSLEHNQIKKDVIGIDIGTGASCIYALLGARWAGWKFIATEADEAAAKVANNNVARNKLGHLVRVLHVSEHSPSLIRDLARQFHDLQFSFCMCNPPFFESCETDKRFSVDKRSGALLNECSVDSEKAERAPPLSATLARRGELEFEGGEVAFIGRLIDDSVLLQTQVR